MTNYTIIRSNRKKIMLELSPKGLIVKAPYTATDVQIEEIVKSHADWIAKHQPMIEEAKRNQPPVEKLTMDEIQPIKSTYFVPNQQINDRVHFEHKTVYKRKKPPLDDSLGGELFL